MSTENKYSDKELDNLLNEISSDISKIEKGKKTHSASAKKSKPQKKKTLKKVIFRSLLSFFTLIIVLVGGVFGAVTVVNYGPSTHIRDVFVMSVMETSAVKFLATWYFSDEEIEKIRLNNSIVPTKEVTNTDLVVIDDKKDNPEFDKSKIEVVEIKGSTYKGLMMIINDPSRVYVGTSGEYGKEQSGRTVMQMMERDGCVAGANGGGFEDEKGLGTGGIPLGIVISDGQLKWGSPASTYELIGFDNENKLVVGYMTGQTALDKGIRDAVSFGPLLIVNGKPTETKGSAGGLNPRTAIGQRADGAVLLLVIDGRQANSLGATFSDLIDIFVEYGAVNAANLDGGSSSHLIYQGEIISTCASLYGPRNIPTAILVKGE